MANATDSKRYREKQKAAGCRDGSKRVDKRRRAGDRHNRIRKSDLPFVGVDGEGGGVDEAGRQNFLLLRAGASELYTGSRLTTKDCLQFIVDLDPDVIHVGFYFNYDATMILRDLNKEQLDRLFKPFEAINGKSRTMQWVFYGKFGIQYLPRQFLAVCRLQNTETGFAKPISGSVRTIYEVGGCFQGKFADQLDNFKIGTEEERKIIRATKEERSDFVVMTPEIRHYNHLECKLLADLMEQFRSNCYAADIKPRTWNGAGKLASALHTANDTIKRSELLKIVDNAMTRMAQHAYYGGRFEVTHIGEIIGKVYEYDIASAYPDAMRELPCLLHGHWHSFEGDGPKTPRCTYVASIHFNHTDRKSNKHLFGLPVRQKKGAIRWPKEGNGVYWSDEIESAKLLGAKITYHKGYEYERRCNCHLFTWVEKLYEYRKSIGKSGAGYPIKLGINSLYGKLAQRIGNPRFGNFIWAGIITARTRAKINRAIAQSPDNILMIATDGIYSKIPLDLPDLDTGKLGSWELTERDGLFIVKPGLWWSGKKTKTRGVAKSSVESRREVFEKEWRDYANDPIRRVDGSFGAPIVPVSVNLFTGLKLANARGKPETAGIWCQDERKISFNWIDKRKSGNLKWNGSAAVTKPYEGGQDIWSVVYADVEETVTQSDFVLDELASQPDYENAASMLGLE